MKRVLATVSMAAMLSVGCGEESSVSVICPSPPSAWSDHEQARALWESAWEAEAEGNREKVRDCMDKHGSVMDRIHGRVLRSNCGKEPPRMTDGEVSDVDRFLWEREAKQCMDDLFGETH